MPLAFTHLALTWSLGLLVSKLLGKKWSPAAMALLTFGAILPDADFVIEWLFDVAVHRTLTHSFVGIALAGAIAYMMLRTSLRSRLKLDSPDSAQFLAFMLMFGVAAHITLDILLDTSGVQLFWPMAVLLSRNGFSWNPVMADLDFSVMEAVLDMAVGCLWLAVLWWRKQLQF